MTTPDYHALCAELTDWLDDLTRKGECDEHPVVTRARALLAAPEAVGVGDEVVENAARILYTAMRFERMESTPAWVERGNSDAQVIAREVARTVLTLYAHPAPVLVGERPWERDGWCDQVRWQQDQPATEGAVNGC
jgi:hypothetical protein